MPDRWDAEAREALCCCDGSRERSHALYCPADNSALVACVVALARHAFREGLEQMAAREVDLIEAFHLWARGIDVNGIHCWCGAAEDNVAPHDDSEHARGCVRLRQMIDPWDGRVPRAERIAAAIRREIEGLG